MSSEFNRTVQEDIDRHGYSVVYVGDAEPPFAYTVGLWGTCKHPELIVFGLSGAIMGSLLQSVAQMVGKGRRFTSKTFLPEIGGRFGVEVSPISTTPLERYFGFAVNFYGEEMPAAQIVWPDGNGRFPDSSQYDRSYAKLQPAL